MHSTRLSVEGMTCASCVGRVERALKGVEGVSEANVNLATETAEVVFGDAVTLPDLVAVLDKAGYPARVEELVFDIEGMTCASCVGRVERALKAEEGVSAASVNLASETATVQVLSGVQDADSLTKAIARAGYKARPRIDREAAPVNRKADEARALRKRLIWAVALTLPVFVIEMGGHLVPALHHWWMMAVPEWLWRMVQFALTAVVLAGPGRVFFAKGLPSLMKGAPDMNALVALGAGAAFLYSSVVTFWPQSIPMGAQNVYFEAAAVIVSLILLGRWLEARAKGRTGEAIRTLAGMRAKTARVERDGAVVEVPIEEIKVGDVLHLRPGEKIAVDGKVLTGESHVDEAMISGEPIPVAKTAGQPVIAGTVNGEGAMTYLAEKVGADTMLAQIIRMVEEAQGAKLPIQSLVDKVTMYFVPAVMALAALTVVIWLMFGPEPALAHALVAGVAVLIIACPCAMGLATPTSIMVGTGRAAELGVLFRKGDALQGLQEVKVIAFDKTGTLTEGRPDVTDLVTIAGDEAALLAEVAAVEAKSEHPIARAIERAAAARGLVLPEVAKARAIAGHGIKAQVGESALLVGNMRLMTREKIDTAAFEAPLAALADQGRTPVLVARDGVAAMVLGISDPVRSTSRQAIAALHARGIKVAMVSGDTRRAAEAVARHLGIDHVEAEVLPKGKAKAVAALREAHGAVGFVGDGINDAPALASADVGIAVGTGTDVAIEAADVVLMRGDPCAVVTAVDVSRKTMGNIRQNLFWAFAYNAALIPVAAGVLYPSFGVQLSPMLGAGAMALSSVFVVSNALRLRRIPTAM
ncbi:heavy metal translocating P-type ATPase [Celeribacter halophilus]|uniref:heavy metal translocating P-type ATPase n=1 Tax=Celeribacter halophilus TaxID=576117 RepID=UPI001C096964|nr:heavy metal translocating P-type ATPase [Celeribacter halophilus]MBU2891561.1 heavy metal translocating P-type ATPase [Celeribacter halophilus]MDO6509719.1 heavy metal translocating P-type ATPase [Celeribacter halophilus]